VKPSLSWVKGVAQTITDEVNRKSDDDDEKAWPPKQPRPS
jgi:hypothetical protein